MANFKTYLSKIVLLSFMMNCITVFSVFAQDIGYDNQISIYISVDGNDSGNGTIDSPYRTLERARDEARKLKEGGRPVTVYLRGGDYSIRESFQLDSKDSGSKESPIIYRSYPGERANLVGGYELEGESAQQVTDSTILEKVAEEARGNILQINLDALGIKDYGQITRPKFFNQNGPSAPELFYNERVMTLARYPNEGYVITGDVIDPGSAESNGDYSNRGGEFYYRDDRPKRWTHAEDIWMYGYWAFDWAAENIKIDSIDIERKTIKTVQPHSYGIFGRKRYYVYNLLEELDSPGEWYLDRKSGMLYFYPPDIIKGSKLHLSLLKDPLVKMNNVSNVIFQDLTFQATCGTGITIEDGEDNLIAGCKLQNMGDMAVLIKGGRHNGVQSCDIRDTGKGAISLIGGVRYTLTPGEHFADNNRISNFSRLSKTYMAAIRIDGVAIRASHNQIYDAPHVAILFYGNDHRIEYNEIYDVTKETMDAGAIYSGRDWTARGNIIDNNYLHDLYVEGAKDNDLAVIGIYLDDMFCSASMSGNVFYRVSRTALIGGGRDNIFKNNIIIDSPQNICIDNRGETWNKKNAEPGGDPYTDLHKVPYQLKPWSVRYPEMYNMLLDEPGVPKYNVVQSNVFYNSGDKLYIYPSTEKYGTIKDNLMTNEDPGFANEKGLDFTLKKDSIVYKKIKGFKEVPFDKMGLKVDEYRKQLPGIGEFRLSEPTNDAMNVKASTTKFRWQPSEGADQYRLVVATDKEFSNIVYDQLVLGTSKVITELKPGPVEYYWKVEAGSKSKNIKSKRWNEGGVWHFSTVEPGKEVIEYSALESLLEDVQKEYDKAIEGTEPGQYRTGAKKTFITAIQSAKQVIGGRETTQIIVEEAVKDLKTAFGTFASSKIHKVMNINFMLNDKNGWDAAPGTLTFNNGKAIFDNSSKKRSEAGFMRQKIPTDSLLQFNAVFDMVDTGWQAISTRTKTTSKVPWSASNNNYLVVVKKDIMEIQKFYEGNIIFETIENKYIESGKEYKITFGAVDTPAGVNIVFYVDDKEIFNIIDNEDPIRDAGYFVIHDFNSGSGPNRKGITLTPAK